MCYKHGMHLKQAKNQRIVSGSISGVHRHKHFLSFIVRTSEAILTALCYVVNKVRYLHTLRGNFNVHNESSTPSSLLRLADNSRMLLSSIAACKGVPPTNQHKHVTFLQTLILTFSFSNICRDEL